MDNYQALTNLLNSQGIEYREHGDEVLLHCLFNGCDDDSHGAEAHLYINKNTGLYDCKKCGEKGNLKALNSHFGITPERQAGAKRLPASLDKQAEMYHVNLPENIREYLQTERLLTDDTIDDYQVGYLQQRGRGWITIPVTDRNGSVLFMKLRQDPFKTIESQPKYKSTGGEASIFNVQVLKQKPDRLVICEGEFDCMVLQGMDIPAICSTAGAGTFKDSWIDRLSFVREFYVVMDNDDAGRKGADNLITKLAEAHPNSSVMHVALPSEVGEHGDITDYFAKSLGSTDDLFTQDGQYVKHAAGVKPIDIMQFSEMSLQDVVDVLALTIKHDDDNKLITFLAMLSAYTDSSQLNISFNAASSTGKSFTAIQVASLFPEADKIELSGASPTSFYHGEGVYVKELDAKMVMLERKILLFYEQPNPDLQAKLRAVLSHDQRELHYRITNKDKKGANRAEEVIIRGFPATVFCSAGLRLDEQETTRAILLSPEITAEKIQAGVSQNMQRGANRAEYDAKLEANAGRRALKDRILAIAHEHVDDIIVPNPEKILQRFNDRFKKAKPRHMRDADHLMSLIKSAALLNVWHRKQPNDLIVASQSDIDQVFELWGRLIEAQDMNVPPAVMAIYKMYILPAYAQKFNDYENQGDKRDMEKRLVGLSTEELSAYYFRKEGAPLNAEQLRKQILPQLQAAGIIVREKPQIGDKRSPHIYPVWYPDGVDNPLEQNYDGITGGVDIPQDVWDMFFGSGKSEKPELPEQNSENGDNSQE